MQLTPTITAHFMSTGPSFQSEGVQTLFLKEGAGHMQKIWCLGMRLVGIRLCLYKLGMSNFQLPTWRSKMKFEALRNTHRHTCTPTSTRGNHYILQATHCECKHVGHVWVQQFYTHFTSVSVHVHLTSIKYMYRSQWGSL